MLGILVSFAGRRYGRVTFLRDDQLNQHIYYSTHCFILSTHQKKNTFTHILIHVSKFYVGQVYFPRQEANYQRPANAA